MTTFREEIKIIAPITHGFTDQLFAATITLAGVDHVQARIQGAAQERFHCFLIRFFKADLRAAEAEYGNLHVCFAELALFHGVESRHALTPCHIAACRSHFLCVEWALSRARMLEPDGRMPFQS